MPGQSSLHEAGCCEAEVALQVVPCLALHDTMRHIKSDVVTVGFGGCMGMSGFLLAVGKKVSHRYSYAQVMHVLQDASLACRINGYLPLSCCCHQMRCLNSCCGCIGHMRAWYVG